MTFQLKKAERKRVKLKISIAAPSGGGKTFSALKLAHGICGDWSKIAVIDTENCSASLYSHLGPFNVIEMSTPYSPERYIDAIETCVSHKMELIIIDSISHEWSGSGGSLDIQAQLGGRFNDWAKVTPRHKKFFDALLRPEFHLIATARTKTEWEVEKNDRGKAEPRKLGTKTEQRDGAEYEFTLAWRLGHNHLAVCDKDRTELFVNRPEFIITEETGKELLAWANSGKPVSEAEQQTRVASIYDGSDDHQAKIKDILIKRKVPEEKWAEVHEKLLGKPSTELNNVIKEIVK